MSSQAEQKGKKTYNTEDSQVVTDPSTNSALCCLYMGERTGSLVFSRMWSYVEVVTAKVGYILNSCENTVSFRGVVTKQATNGDRE